MLNISHMSKDYVGIDTKSGGKLSDTTVMSQLAIYRVG